MRASLFVLWFIFFCVFDVLKDGMLISAQADEWWVDGVKFADDFWLKNTVEGSCSYVWGSMANQETFPYDSDLSCIFDDILPTPAPVVANQRRYVIGFHVERLFPFHKLSPSEHSTSLTPHTCRTRNKTTNKGNRTQTQQTYDGTAAETTSDTYIQVYGQGGIGVGWSNFLVWQDIHGYIYTRNKVFVGNLTFENVGEIEKIRFLTWEDDGLSIDTFWADGLNHTKLSGFYDIDGSGGSSCDGVEIDFLLDTGTDIGNASCPLSFSLSFLSLVGCVCVRGVHSSRGHVPLFLPLCQTKRCL